MREIAQLSGGVRCGPRLPETMATAHAYLEAARDGHAVRRCRDPAPAPCALALIALSALAAARRFERYDGALRSEHRAGAAAGAAVVTGGGRTAAATWRSWRATTTSRAATWFRALRHYRDAAHAGSPVVAYNLANAELAWGESEAGLELLRSIPADAPPDLRRRVAFTSATPITGGPIPGGGAALSRRAGAGPGVADARINLEWHCGGCAPRRRRPHLRPVDRRTTRPLGTA